jgi:hypothetical protein
MRSLVFSLSLSLIVFSACDMFGPNDQVIITGEVEGADKRYNLPSRHQWHHPFRHCGFF